MRLQGLVYRAHHPRWAFAPASGEGAARSGGRFNPVGMPALYTARRLETAWLEAQQGFAFKAQPMTMCAYRVNCEDVLDLTDPAVLTLHGITPAELGCAWLEIMTSGLRPPSWMIAERLIGAGIAAVIVPSFAAQATADDVNVVFWKWGPERAYQMRVIDEFGRLPRDDSTPA